MRAALLCAAALALFAGAAHAGRVRGVVVDRAGRAVEYAQVACPTLKRGVATDADGRFELELPDGAAVLEVVQLGYERLRLTVTVAGDGAPLRLVLAEEPVPLAEVTVSTSSFGKTGSAEGPVLSRMDVYTTPGGAADVFQSLRALPGTNAPAEGAAVYVRGGTPDETMVRLDGGSIGHPYHYERASGGLFSVLDPSMLESAFFSSGGFSARYGGALSGVLDIQTRDPRDQKTVSLGANLAGGGGSVTWPLVPGVLSGTAALRLSRPELLFRLYGSSREYESAPESGDLAAKLLWRYSPTGKLSAAFLGSASEVAVYSDVLNWSGVYRDHTGNRLATLDLADVAFAKLAVRGQASWQDFDTRWTFGAADAGEREQNLQANLEAVWPLSPRHELTFGGNLRRRRAEITGTLHADSTDFGAGAPVRRYDTRPEVDYPGVFVEHKLRVAGPLYATLGGRFDRASVPGTWTADPRAALALRLGEHHTLRLASGRYHQLPAPEHLDPVYGNPRLAPLRADHVILGWEWRQDATNVRVEAYRKDYRGLVTQDSVAFFANGGHGRARGVDVFVQGRLAWLSGWLSYGWLDARRKELDDPRELPSAHGVRHTMTLVGQYQLASAWQLGVRYGLSSGRPWTPVVGRTWDEARQMWRPVFGENHSATLPEYHRVDLRVTRLFSMPRGFGLPASSVCVAYVETLNLLDTPNVLEYVYDADYTERRERESYFGRRLAVAGVSLSW